MDQIIENTSNISATWLTGELRKSVFKNQQEILDLKLEPIAESIGFLSRIYRIVPTYSEDNEDLPVSIILKIHTDRPEFFSVGERLKAFDRESGFYRHISPLIKGRLPKIYASYSQGGKGWILMEDLSRMTNGNQIYGLNHQEIKASLSAISSVHAYCWQSCDQYSYPWLPTDDFWFRVDPQPLWTNLKECYGLRIGEEAITLLDEYVMRHDEIFSRLQKCPRTIVHGDLRADNLLIDNNDQNNPNITIIDWQTVTISAGAIDVAFLILGSEPAPERHGHFKDLVSHWHSNLVSLGVKNYSLSEAYRDVRLASLACLSAPIKAFAELGGPNFKNAKEAQLAECFIFRHIEASVELNLSELL
jgi:serine/threonine protein kinase